MMTNAQAALMAASQTAATSYVNRTVEDVVTDRAAVFLHWLETDGKQPTFGIE